MIDRIARRYEGRWLQGYARGKLRGDPVYAALFEELKGSPLPVLDVGCGLGLLAFYLRERGFTPPITGVDFDAKKIAQARRAAAHSAGVDFVTGEATEVNGFAGHVVLADVLHYLPRERQRLLLERVAAQVPPGGLCLIRTMLRDASWRFRFTQIEEFFLCASRWMKSGAVHYPSRSEILAPFDPRTFTSEVRPLWAGTPFNSHLIVMRRIA